MHGAIIGEALILINNCQGLEARKLNGGTVRILQLQNFLCGQNPEFKARAEKAYSRVMS